MSPRSLQLKVKLSDSPTRLRHSRGEGCPAPTWWRGVSPGPSHSSCLPCKAASAISSESSSYSENTSLIPLLIQQIFMKSSSGPHAIPNSEGMGNRTDKRPGQRSWHVGNEHV